MVKKKTKNLREVQVIIIIAIAALVFTWWWRNLKSGSHTTSASSVNSAQTLVSEALAKTVAVKSYHIDTQLDLHLLKQVNQQNRSLPDVLAHVQGDVQITTDNQLQLLGQLHLEASGQGTKLFTDGEARIFPDAVAFRLSTLPVTIDPTGNLVDKWTYVDTKLLPLSQSTSPVPTLVSFWKGLQYDGYDQIDGVKLWHYDRQVTAADETKLAAAAMLSNNQALVVLARLLNSYDVKSFDVWVDPKDAYIRQVVITFKQPGDESSSPTESARLVIRLNDFGKTVKIDRPPQELTVEPSAFTKLFGMGQISSP